MFVAFLLEKEKQPALKKAASKHIKIERGGMRRERLFFVFKQIILNNINGIQPLH